MKYTDPDYDPRIAFFDERAETWEERCYPPEARIRLQELIAHFGISSGQDILDLGCGCGILGPYVRPLMGEEARLLAADISRAMLRMAATKHEYTMCLHASAMDLSLPDAHVDKVLCFAAFPHFSDKTRALAEIYRVLRQGGSLVIAHLLSREELAQHHGGKSAVASDALPDDAAMRALLSQTGFSEVTIIDLPGRYLASAKKE